MVKLDTVVIFGKENCKACESAKQYFDSKHIPYIYTLFKNIDSKSKKIVVRKLKEKNTEGLSYPIIYINGVYLFGFNPKFLNDNLQIV